MKKSIIIYQSHNSFEADMIEHVLRDHGIPFQITGRADAGLYNILPIQIMIPEDFKEEAQELIASIQGE